MFTLCLDLHLRFVPPMAEHAPGIVLTRVFEFPFPPYSGLAIYGKAVEEYPTLEGLQLNGVVWDLDRKVFLAHTVIVYHDEPLAFVAKIVRGWMVCGWGFGSYSDAYPEADYSSSAGGDETELDDAEYERLEVLHTLPKSKRDQMFNKFFKAMIREMSEHYNNLPSAYAMDKLGRLLEEIQPYVGAPLSDSGRLWIDTCREFDQLDSESQTAWQDKVAKYPSLEKVLSSKQATRKI